MTKEIRPSPFAAGLTPGRTPSAPGNAPVDADEATVVVGGKDAFEPAAWLTPAGAPTAELNAEGAEVLREHAAANPETAEQLDRWSTLSSHREALASSLKDAKSALKRWR